MAQHTDSTTTDLTVTLTYVRTRWGWEWSIRSEGVILDTGLLCGLTLSEVQAEVVGMLPVGSIIDREVVSR